MKTRFLVPLMVCLLVLILAQLGCSLTSSETSTGPLTWKLVTTGDCKGFDMDETEGSIPDDSKAKAGYTAVCWDGDVYNNQLRSGEAFCTYKKIEISKCTGGLNTGEMYTAEP